MAYQTIKNLLEGNVDTVEYYNNARRIWKDIRESEHFGSVESLAQEISRRESEFNHKCGGRELGEELLAYVGIGQFYSYSPDFGLDANIEEVTKIKDAIEMSMCRFEVKAKAEGAAKFFGSIS